MSGQGSGFGGQGYGGAPGQRPPEAGYPHISQHYVHPIKKDKTLLYLGLGCGGLVLLMLGALAGLVVWGYFKAKTVLESASGDFDRVTGAVGKMVVPGGAICAQATSCCRKVMLKLNNQNEYDKCDSFLEAPAAACQAQLAAFSTAARNLELTCDPPAPDTSASPQGSTSAPAAPQPTEKPVSP